MCISDFILLGYIDPMSGAVVLQFLVAGLVGAAAVFRRTIWGAVRALLHLKGGPETPKT